MMHQIQSLINICSNTTQINQINLQSAILTLASNMKKIMIVLNKSGLLSNEDLYQGSQYGNQNQFHPGSQKIKPNDLFSQVSQQIFSPLQGKMPFIDTIPNQIQQNARYGYNTNNQIEKKKYEQNTKIISPVLLTYINRIPVWWPPQSIAAGMGVPGYAQPTMYNYFVLTFWTYSSGPVDIVKIWSDPIAFMGNSSVFGTNKNQIQKNIKKKYNDNGIKLMISAFGGTQFPTTAKVDPRQCAEKLGNFVLENNLDGVDIDWEDNTAMESGTGEQWVITFHVHLRKIIPNHIITHAPQAPYFKQQHYKNGAYVKINRQVGHLIDFYNVQFYNQGNTKYDSYENLFLKSGSYFSGTSVSEIASRGIPLQKIIVGKPAKQSDAANTGWVNHAQLGKWINKANANLNWRAGVMYWQYISDLDGNFIKQTGGQLKKS